MTCINHCLEKQTVTMVWLAQCVCLHMLSDLQGPEGWPNGPEFQESSQQETRHCSHRGHQRALKCGNSTFNLWLVNLNIITYYTNLWSNIITEKDLKCDFMVFQSRNASLSPTTSTQLWRMSQTVSMFYPLTPTLRTCLRPSEMAFCSGKAVIWILLFLNATYSQCANMPSSRSLLQQTHQPLCAWHHWWENHQQKEAHSFHQTGQLVTFAT